MTEQNFLLNREHVWKEFSKIILGSRRELKKDAVSFSVKYREMVQDLNTAKAYGFDPAIIERLNTLVNEGNQILYARRGWSFKAPLHFIWNVFPQKVRSQWRGILAVTLVFYFLEIFFAVLCIRFPDIPEELISRYDLRAIESMYDPESFYYLKPREITKDADMFGYYIFNNISIAFRTFAGGIFAGIGSLFILLVNAVYMGIIEGHLINLGYARTLFAFIIAHSAFELTAIIFCGYAGLLLGFRFFVTNGLTRKASIRKAGQNALPIVGGSTIMLVIAAVIEAFWSSQHMLPFSVRIGVGVFMWILVLLYFLLAGRNNEPSV